MLMLADFMGNLWWGGFCLLLGLIVGAAGIVALQMWRRSKVDAAIRKAKEKP